MPPQLMELMRHESIGTTLRFYVGRNAEKTADAAWAAYEAARGGQQATPAGGPINTSVNSEARRASDPSPRNDASRCFATACEVPPEGLEPSTF